eukprot:1191530-Prorocentrum_minimum.AAC.2
MSRSAAVLLARLPQPHRPRALVRLRQLRGALGDVHVLLSNGRRPAQARPAVRTHHHHHADRPDDGALPP